MKAGFFAVTIVVVLASCERAPSVEIDEPKAVVVGNTVTFRWHWSPAAPSGEYRFEILLDKGVDPCDGGIEESFDAGSSMCKTISLDRRRFHPGAKAEWAIGVHGPGPKRTCIQGGTFTVDPAVPPPPSCGGGS